MTRIRSIILLLLYTNYVAFATNSRCNAASKSDDFYLIRTTSSCGLALDATDPTQIKLQFFTGYDAQLWHFEPGEKPGTFYIINKHTENFLDYSKGSLAELVLNDRNNSLDQQWYLNSNGRIVNAAKSQNIDVYGGKFDSGNKVVLWPNNDSAAQEFILQKKT